MTSMVHTGLAHLVLPNGHTIGEHISEGVAALMLGGSPSMLALPVGDPS